MTPEGKVKAKVKDRMAAEFGDHAYRFMPVQNGMGAPALDFYYCVRGLFVAIETKAPGKKPTPRQERTMCEIEAAGGKAFVIDGDAGVDFMIARLRTCLPPCL